MLLRKELVDRLADTLEGIAISNAHAASPSEEGRREASVLVYHSSGVDVGGPVAGESPLLEINLAEGEDGTSVIVTSALGIAEMHGVEEIRLLAATEEAAFYAREAGDSAGTVSMLTVSSRGALQVYMNVPESLGAMELSNVKDVDLRAAIALKIFAEHTEVFLEDE